jgi:hypothetical protein
MTNSIPFWFCSTELMFDVSVIFSWTPQATFGCGANFLAGV